MNNPHQLGAMLTLETARIFFSQRCHKYLNENFRQRTRLGNNPRQLGAMLTLETARIFSTRCHKYLNKKFRQKTGLRNNPRQLLILRHKFLNN